VLGLLELHLEVLDEGVEGGTEFLILMLPSLTLSRFSSQSGWVLVEPPLALAIMGELRDVSPGGPLDEVIHAVHFPNVPRTA
jgi:hypothetical protein